MKTSLSLLSLNCKIKQTQEKIEAKTRRLGDIERMFESIDPKLVGKQRFAQTTSLAKKILTDLYYTIRSFYYKQTMTDLRHDHLQLQADLLKSQEELRLAQQSYAALENQFTVENAPSLPSRVILRLWSPMRATLAGIANICIQPFSSQKSERKSPVALSANPQHADFNSLPITDDDKRRLRVLFPSIANDDIKTLLGKLPEIFKAKAELKALHPLRSLEEIFKNPDLRADLLTISKSSPKWIGVRFIAKGFLPQTAEKLRTWDMQGSLLPYISGFAKNLQLSKEQEAQLAMLARGSQWEEFIQALVTFFTPS